jgi:hypothetical protein|tara:strand:+ start:367 stop:1428 length:1062 start_codon:yes stop_codon:yes gene_type:complete
MNPNKKRVGLNPKQLAIMEQIRNLSEADVAKGARIAKKKLGLKACYPVMDTSLDPDLFDPVAVATKGWCEGTIRRYTSYFLGIAKKKDEKASDARKRFMTVPHPFSPLVRGGDGKMLPKWAGVFASKRKPPVRFVSERLLLFLVLGLAIVKGTEATKASKNAARKALWNGLGIRPATVVPISEDDELTFWNSVTTPIPDPEMVIPEPTEQGSLFPTSTDVDAAIEAFGGSPLNTDTGTTPPPSPTEEGEEAVGEAEDLLLQGLAMLTQGIKEVIAQSRILRTEHGRLLGQTNKMVALSEEIEDREELVQVRERELNKREHALDTQEKAMREKEAVLAQVLRVTEGLRDGTRVR